MNGSVETSAIRIENRYVVVPLLRREGRSLRPPSPGEYLLSGSDYGRDRRFRAQSRLGWDVVLSRRQEGFGMQLRGRLPDSRSGRIIADFTIFLLANRPLSHKGTLQKL